MPGPYYAYPYYVPYSVPYSAPYSGFSVGIGFGYSGYYGPRYGYYAPRYPYYGHYAGYRPYGGYRPYAGPIRYGYPATLRSVRSRDDRREWRHRRESVALSLRCVTGPALCHASQLRATRGRLPRTDEPPGDTDRMTEDSTRSRNPWAWIPTLYLAGGCPTYWS